LPSSIGAAGAVAFTISLKNRYDSVEISADSNKPIYEMKTPTTIAGT
jgi:hypothetical protein